MRGMPQDCWRSRPSTGNLCLPRCAGATSSPSMVERIVIQLAYRHAAIRPSVELLTLWASDRRPPRHAAVGLSIELLAFRASDRRPRRHAAVRPSVELLALRASDRGLRRHALALRDDERLAGRANIWHLGRGHRNEVRSDTQRGE